MGVEKHFRFFLEENKTKVKTKFVSSICLTLKCNLTESTNDTSYYSLSFCLYPSLTHTYTNTYNTLTHLHTNLHTLSLTRSLPSLIYTPIHTYLLYTHTLSPHTHTSVTHFQHTHTLSLSLSQMLLSLIKRLINLELNYALKTFRPYNNRQQMTSFANPDGVLTFYLSSTFL